MSKKLLWLRVAVYTFVTILVGVAAMSTVPGIPRMCIYELKPLTRLVPSGPVDFELSITTDSANATVCNPATVIISTRGKVRIMGDTSWNAQLSKNGPYKAVIHVLFTPDDTAEITATVLCPVFVEGMQAGDHWRFYFVTTKDSVEVWQHYPFKPEPPPDPRGQAMAGNRIPGEFPDMDSMWGILKVEPVSVPKHAGTVDLRLMFSPTRHPCDSVVFKIGTEGGLLYSGKSTWIMSLVSGIPIDTVISVIVPDKSRTAVHVGMQCGAANHFAELRFFTIGDTLEYYNVHPWHREDVPPLWETGHIDTTLVKMLDSINMLPKTAECFVTIFVKDSNQLNYVKSLGIRVKGVGYEMGRAAYKCRTSQENLIRLQKQQILIRFDRPNKDSDSKKGGENKRDKESPIGGEVHDTLRRSSSVSPMALPDLAICFPNGWEFPAVPSGRRNTLVSGDLWAGETTFVDWCVDNESNIPISMTSPRSLVQS